MLKLAAAENIYFADRNALRAWFLRHHSETASFWLVYDKVKDGKRHLLYAEIVEESLCFGFIDSQPRKISDTQAAKKDGSWNKINASENLVEPEDFKAALKQNKKRRAHFDRLAPSTRKAFLHRLLSAKTQDTRANRMAFLMQLLDLEMQPSEFRLAFTKGIMPQR